MGDEIRVRSPHGLRPLRRASAPAAHDDPLKAPHSDRGPRIDAAAVLLGSRTTDRHPPFRANDLSILKLGFEGLYRPASGQTSPRARVVGGAYAFTP